MIGDVLEFFNKIMDILNALVESVVNTTDYLDGVNFDETIIAQYLGYVHWIVGTPNYIALTTLFAIGAGVAIWSFSVKIVTMLKSFLPW